MKKLLTTAALVTGILFNLPAYAGMQKNQTASQPAMAVMTIEQIQGLGDDAPVMVEGMIINSLGDEKYTLKDSTGATMIVEIDDEDWNGMKMPSPNEMVVITGETDKEGNITEIDVDTISMKQ